MRKPTSRLAAILVIAIAGAASATWPASATKRETVPAAKLDPLIPLGQGFVTTVRSPADCQRWRRIAARLGETYAGFRLRKTIVARACAFYDGLAEEEPWSWPWRNDEMAAELPPRLQSRYGDWQVRCGRAGQRRRCALMTTSVLVGAPDPDHEDMPLISHFVIDTVSGREILLWRMHVGSDIARANGVAIAFDGRRIGEAFDICGRVGCIVETETRLSSDAANWLWDGKEMTITLGRPGPLQWRAVLSGRGFRSGLSELMRLRRSENRSLAGR